MHLLIPFAAPLPDTGHPARPAGSAGLPALPALPELPNLQRLFGRLAEAERDEADVQSPSPPHERALARAWGWRGAAGCLPFAARAAQADGIDTGELAWGLLTPAHWHLGTDQVSLVDPDSLALDEAASRALLDAVRPLFEGEGWALHYGAPLRWYAAHDSLAGLATASLDRVIGRNVDAWLGTDPAARRIRRLQSEVQMLLYTQALNDDRQAQGLPSINSFWLSGCGRAQPAAGPSPEVDDRLRGPALAGDPPAWAQAWQALDAGPLATLDEAAARGRPVQLTLCGERAWARYATAAGGPLRRLRQRWSAPRAAAVLAAL
ncbi:MAG: hypothetical protein KGJ24_14015 [Burkholderiales bacterium]|nr:hypothetical protein [Burkholderiales bacterium]